MNNGSVLIDSLLVTWTRSRFYAHLPKSRAQPVTPQPGGNSAESTRAPPRIAAKQVPFSHPKSLKIAVPNWSMGHS